MFHHSISGTGLGFHQMRVATPLNYPPCNPGTELIWPQSLITPCQEITRDTKQLVIAITDTINIHDLTTTLCQEPHWIRTKDIIVVALMKVLSAWKTVLLLFFNCTIQHTEDELLRISNADTNECLMTIHIVGCWTIQNPACSGCLIRTLQLIPNNSRKNFNKGLHFNTISSN